VSNSLEDQIAQAAAAGVNGSYGMTFTFKTGGC
jgi:hypothetical protein